MSKLALRGIEKHYGNMRAVVGLDLDLKEGEFVSLLGPSGCGKTTTLRMIAGFIEPTAGTIEMDGQMLSSPVGVLPPEKRQMSMIFQSYAVWPNMTVERNVGFGLELRRLPRNEIRPKIDCRSSAAFRSVAKG
jgi:iron(III) transport system ATP-binding protein